MGRVYRSTVNGSISTADGLRLSTQLKEIRCCMEAVAAEEAYEAANQPVGQVDTINVLSIKHGQNIDLVNGTISWHPTAIEPPPELEPTPEPALEPDKGADGTFNTEPPIEPTLTSLESKLLEMNHDQLLELARTLNVGR